MSPIYFCGVRHIETRDGGMGMKDPFLFFPLLTHPLLSLVNCHLFPPSFSPFTKGAHFFLVRSLLLLLLLLLQSSGVAPMDGVAACTLFGAIGEGGGRTASFERVAHSFLGHGDDGRPDGGSQLTIARATAASSFPTRNIKRHKSRKLEGISEWMHTWAPFSSSPSSPHFFLSWASLPRPLSRARRLRRRRFWV